MHALKAANLAVRFLLELAMLAALAYWGTQTNNGAASVALAIAAPLAAAIVWGAAVSPKAPLHPRLRLRVLLELVLFGLAVAALASTGAHALAWIFAATVVVSEALLLLLRD